MSINDDIRRTKEEFKKLAQFLTEGKADISRIQEPHKERTDTREAGKYVISRAKWRKYIGRERG